MPLLLVTIDAFESRFTAVPRYKRVYATRALILACLVERVRPAKLISNKRDRSPAHNRRFSHHLLCVPTRNESICHRYFFFNTEISVLAPRPLWFERSFPSFNSPRILGDKGSGEGAPVAVAEGNDRAKKYRARTVRAVE